ncbi:MAG: rRNA maturation RNase YbeY [Bacteroidales bacterium]|nr:rRNA maturation RNase YbeY [Bacteroidales bacterium]
MAISFHSENIQFDLTFKSRHKQWIRACIEAYKKHPEELAFVFTSNEQLRLMNQEYLNHNYFTDVITFDYSEGVITSGDIFISIDQVKMNADLYGVNSEEELRRVMIHGVFHLMGFTDGTAEEVEIMRKKENEALHLWLKKA